MAAAVARACGSWTNTASPSGTFLSTLGINSWLGSGPDPETGADLGHWKDPDVAAALNKGLGPAAGRNVPWERSSSRLMCASWRRACAGWTTEFAEAEHLLRDIDMSLQERDFKQRRGADAAKITAAVRGCAERALR